jgi:hypothetical protein
MASTADAETPFFGRSLFCGAVSDCAAKAGSIGSREGLCPLTVRSASTVSGDESGCVCVSLYASLESEESRTCCRSDSNSSFKGGGCITGKKKRSKCVPAYRSRGGVTPSSLSPFPCCRRSLFCILFFFFFFCVDGRSEFRRCAPNEVDRVIIRRNVHIHIQYITLQREQEAKAPLRVCVCVCVLLLLF